jgi:hypothetical protein
MTERGVDAMSFEQSRSDSDLMQGAVAHGAAGMRGGLRQGPMCAGRINTPGPRFPEQQPSPNELRSGWLDLTRNGLIGACTSYMYGSVHFVLS